MQPSTIFQDKESFTIFQSSNAWKAKEELLLLDAIEQYGFGNWEDVSNHVETRTSEEAQEHYDNMYIIGNIGRVTWPSDMKCKPKDHTCPEGGPLSPSLMAKLSPLELSSSEQQELGYMPHRDDFEREYDNEAEVLVSNLVINQDDEDIDLALKLAHVDMYSKRLKERLRRKRVAREYSLVNQFFSNSNKQKSQSSKKKYSKEERSEKEFLDKMRIFGQFHSAREHEQLFENMQKEKELKARTKELMRYRRNGITKLDECEEFETARYKREKKKENKKKSGSSSSSHRRSAVIAKKEEKANESLPDEHGGSANDGKEEAKELDMSSLPGYEMLSEREKKLCSSLGLKPSKYITLKTVLIKDHIQKRQGIPTKPRYPAGLDKSHRRKIVNFLMNSGWITAC